MPLQKGYEVVRFQKQGGESYKVMDYKRGELLYQVCANHDHQDKEEFLRLLRLFTVETDCLSREKAKKKFFPVTPYNTLFTEEGEVAFLEPEGEGNKEIIRTLKRDPACREFWRAEDLKGYDSRGTYLYGYGKTLQYLLAHVTIYPKLTFHEERCFLHIIQSCINHKPDAKVPDFQHILKKLPKGTNRKRKKVFCIAVGGTVILLSIFLGLPKKAKETRAAPQHAVKQMKREEKKDTSAYMELGMSYFLKEEYGQSRKYFAELPKKKEAVCFRALSEYMMGMDTGEDIQSYISEAQSMQTEEYGAKLDLSLFRIQRTLDGEPAWTETARLGVKTAEELEQFPNEEKSAAAAEVYEGLAEVYGIYGEVEKEIEAYQKVLEANPKRGIMEAVYLKLPELYVQKGEQEQAAVIARQAAEAMPYSISLRIQYIRYQCKSGASNEECAETILQAIKEIPELTKSVSFQKLQREFNIRIEGESVWVEK